MNTYVVLESLLRYLVSLNIQNMSNSLLFLHFNKGFISDVKEVNIAFVSLYIHILLRVLDK